jgi:hypothetical protein
MREAGKVLAFDQDVGCLTTQVGDSGKTWLADTGEGPHRASWNQIQGEEFHPYRAALFLGALKTVTLAEILLWRLAFGVGFGVVGGLVLDGGQTHLWAAAAEKALALGVPDRHLPSASTAGRLQ